MVFEKIVVDNLNRLLGEYFENFDTSHLKLGLWGGDVVLQNLVLKPSVLDDFGPFKVAVGKLGKLTMKIPWTSLYTAPVILNLQDLYLLAMPSPSITYNEELEEKVALVGKQKEIQRIEEARLREAAKAKGPSKPEDDTFTDKIVAQIIKNVQIRIESIHIRYEDVTSNPSRPFSAGVILKNLYIETTNAEWKPQIITETVHVVHKLADLKGLSVYWNSDSTIINDGKADAQSMLKKMQEFISNDKIAYVLGPIFSEAKLKLVANPERGEHPFSLPKMLINVVMQELALGMTNYQFQDIMHLVESLGYMYRSQHYRKYRPLIGEHRGQAKEWWQFAYRCVVGEEVRRRRLNWDWEHIKQHRELCKVYANVYYEKKTLKKVSQTIEEEVKHCEKVLDIFNITLVRKQVEVRLARKGAEVVSADQNKKGWFSWSGWFGDSASPQASVSSSAGIVQIFEEALTPEEKKELYNAIDYSEDALPLDYPKEFEEYVLNFHLCCLKLTVRDEAQKTKVNQIVKLNIVDLVTSVKTRPVKSGLRIDINLADLYANGTTKYDVKPPYIIKMNKDTGNSEKLLLLQFENRPLKSDVDTKIFAKAQPLEIFYHSETFDEIVKCFTLPKATQINKLHAAAVSTLEEWKHQSASRLQYMMDQRGEVEVDIEMVAPFLIVPKDGKLNNKDSVLVVNLGAIQVKSQPRNRAVTEKLDFEQIKEQSYDRFVITLKDFQVILALPGENYRSYLGSSGHDSTKCEITGADNHPLYLINLSTFVVLIEQSLVQDDPRLEKLKISATLPLLDVSISENRLLELVTLLLTLPLPLTDQVLDMDIEFKVEDIPSINEAQAISKLTYDVASDKNSRGTEIVQFTELIATIGVDCVKAKLTRFEVDQLKPFATLELNRLQTKLISKTFGTEIDAAIGGLSLEVYEHRYPDLQGPMYLLKTRMSEEENSYLLKVNLFLISPDCPVHLASNIKQRLTADISSLDIVLHLQALREIIDFGHGCMSSISSAMNKETIEIGSMSVGTQDPVPPLSTQVSWIEAQREALAKNNTNDKDILLQCEAHLNQLSVQMSSEDVNLMKIVLSEIDASYNQYAKTSSLFLRMRDLTVLNLNPQSPYKQLVSVDADEVVNVHVEMYDQATIGQDYFDMNRYDLKVKVETGSPQIIYLGTVIADVVTFIDAFQTAKDVVIDLARENVEQVYASSSRILLDIALMAPKIILPKNERSGDAFMADLGNLTLKNMFKKINVVDITDVAIMDEMHVNLDDIKLSRVFIQPETGIIRSEVSVVDPISMSVEVVRNLSSDWFSSIPAIKIEGSLDSCFVRFSNEDYSMLMRALKENLGSSGKLKVSEPAIKTSPGKKINSKFKEASMVDGTVSRTKTLEPVIEETDEIRIDLQMNLTIDKMSLRLYGVSPELKNGKGLMERGASTAFADFSIRVIDFAMKTFSSENSKVDIVEDIPSINETQAISKLTYDIASEKNSRGAEIAQFTELIATIGVDRVKAKLTRFERDQLKPFAALELNCLQTKLISKTFGTEVDAAVGGLSLEVYEHRYPDLEGPMYLLKTPISKEGNSYLLKVNLFLISPDSPVYVASNVKQRLTADISSLDIVLHLQALREIIDFGHGCMSSITNAMNKETNDISSVSVSSQKPVLPQPTQVSRIEAQREALAKNHTNYKDILLQCEAHLNQLSVQMSSEDINLMKIVLSKIDGNYNQYAKTSAICLKMKELNVINLNPQSPYKQLVRVDADQVVNVHVEMHDEATIGEHYFDMNRYDMKVKVETGSPRIIYFGSVIADVMTFLDSFQTAKDAVIDLARENVENVYASSSRILLDVLLMAPKVILPRNESSGDALMADLGNLTLKNVLKKISVPGITDVAIMDEMHVNLDNIKLSRVFLEPVTGILRSEVSVLDPISMNVEVVRNLSLDSSYSSIPAINIKGSLDSCFVRISNEDYSMLMLALKENLGAPGKLKSNVKNSVTRAQFSTSANKKKDGQFKETSTVDGTVSNGKTFVPVIEESDRIRIDFQISLAVSKLSLRLYSASPELKNDMDFMERDAATAFADFSINMISLAMNTWSNGDMKVYIMAKEINLEDCRPGNRAITNIIQRKHEQDKNSMVRVTYETDGANKAGPSLGIKTTSLVVVLSVDYLLQLSTFFLTNASTPAPEPPVHGELPHLHHGSSNEAVGTREMARNRMDQEGYNKELVNTRMYFNMAETEIVLVEDRDTVHANALLLNCEVSLKMVSNEEKTNMVGTLENLKLSTCNYDPQIHRHKKIAEVISPISITAVMNSSNEGRTSINLKISNILIRLTAGTLELLLKIFTGITLSSSVTETANEPINYEDLWSVKEVSGLDLWYLKPGPDVTVEVGTEVDSDEKGMHPPNLLDVANDLIVRERIILEPGCIIITFEAGGGSNTMPLLLIKSDIDDFQILDWSTKLQVSGRMKLEAGCYNTKLGVWEFLIEPNETRHRGKMSHQPWEMQFKYNTFSKEQEKHVKSLPYKGVTLQSNEILEMTVSKSALDVISVLAQEFQAAAKSLISDREVMNSPYKIVNDLGTPIKLNLKDSPFVYYRQGVSYEEALLDHGTSVNLGLNESLNMTKHYSSVLREQEGRDERLLNLNIPKFRFTSKIPLNRAEKRYYSLPVKTEVGQRYEILCDIAVKDCSKVLTIRGLVQIANELPVPVDVFAMDEQVSAGSWRMIGTIEVNGYFNLPLEFLYAKTCELSFAPKGYRKASLPSAWRSFMMEVQSINYLVSESLGQGRKFYIKVVSEVKQTLFESTNRKTLASKCCYIYLRPPLVINNLLPVPIGYFTDDDPTIYTAEKGSTVTVTNLQVMDSGEFSLKLIIDNYQGLPWIASLNMRNTTSELSPCDFTTPDNVYTMCLGIHKEIVDETKLLLHVYCPFWMVNRTGLDLYYKGDFKDTTPTVIRHRKGNDQPVMFSSKGNAFVSKKRAFIKFEGSDWSENFSLDVAGSSGTVTCKSPGREFQVGIKIMLMSWGLTKTIIFSPRFYLISQCPYTIYVQETQQQKYDHNDNLIELLPRSCLPFWPNLADPYLVAFIKGTTQKTKSIRYDHAHHVLLQLLNKYGGIHVDVHVTETSTVITFSEYVKGHGPVLLVNATPDCCIEFREKGVQKPDTLILPGCCQYLAWEDPMGERTIEWNPNTFGKVTTVADKLLTDGTGRFNWVDQNKHERSYFWISFLDGLQRVLLFTHTKDLPKLLQAANESEQVISEYVIKFHGLGLSLVDGDKGQEILYLRIASSEIGWQASKFGKSKRFKPLPVPESTAIETAYQNYLNEKVILSNAKSHITLDSGVEVDFASLSIVKPNPRELRRDFQTGIWINYRNYPHSNHFNAKLYRIQIDNQLPDANFHVVLAPVDPPKSISAQREPRKPFAEVSVIQRITAHSSVTQYKYFKVLIQEFLIRADIGFINAVAEVFGFFFNPAVKMDQMATYFKKDFEKVSTPMQEKLSRQIVAEGQKDFYDFLHFSPLKVHLSFSMGGSAQLSNNFLNSLLRSFGVTLSEVQDVVFKLSCLELQHQVLSSNQLYDRLYNHYKAQAIKQLYVLVFGLDVIGNPYGLVLGVTEGVGAFFYEPIQGAIQGPGEFAEGLALGFKSLLGHTVGGAAGALSRITGTVGKGVAALTLDEEFKQNRRETLTKRPNNAGEAFAQSGKGLVKGFSDGVTGVLMKPIKGAQDDGAKGFFKGLGKGAVGLFARPATGIVDFASVSLEAMKRATAVADDARRLRPSRHIPIDSAVQPYIRHEGEGVQILQGLEKGTYACTDEYNTHAVINPQGMYVFLLTNKRLFYVRRDDVFGGWTIQWTHLWEEFLGPPFIVEKELVFKLKPPERKHKILRKPIEKELIVPIHDPNTCKWIIGKIETAMKFEAGDY